MSNNGDPPYNMDGERSHDLWGISTAVLLGLFLRLIPARNALVGGEIQFYHFDSFYHLRRILYTVDNFPSTLWFDSYLNHPLGFSLSWPPLFDQIGAALSLLLGGSPRAVEVAAAVIPPMLGTLMILLTYLLAKKLFGVRVALLSAFLLATDSKHIARTIFGFPDHDSLELLLIIGSLLLLSYALTERERKLAYGAAAGVLLAAVAYTWLGAPIYMVAILIYASVQTALDLRRGDTAEDTIIPLAAAFGASLLLFLPFWNEKWLIPSFIGALGSLAALTYLCVLSRLFAEKTVPWQAFFPVVMISAYLALILSSATEIGSNASRLLMEGLGYFLGTDLARLGISEATPIFGVYELVSFPILSLVFALAGLVLLVRSIGDSEVRRDRLLFVIWASFSAALMIFQARFIFLFSISGSILVALLFFWGNESIRSNDRLQEMKPGTVGAIAGLFFLLLLLPSVSNLPQMAENGPEIAGDWSESLDWLRENTPPTASYERPIQAGEYGVLSWWDYGNWILYRSKRPVVANNFQAGAKASAEFFLAQDEEEALATAEARDVRYVITDADMVYSKLPVIARWIDEDPGSYVAISSDSEISTFEHSPKFMKTTLAKLHILDCTDLGRFRLIYESENSSGLKFSVSKVKIFERVPGARIAGKTPYDEPMGVILEMTSNQGRRFQYFNSVMPVDGRYEIRVPYSTDERLETHSVGPYLLGPVMDIVGGEAREIEVSEEDVLNGRTIEADF